jgi:lysophospholipase L1-like esterase
MNTNPHAKRILCFGDSNTWGYISGTNHLRLSVDKRWTGVLQNVLGNEYDVIEEGLNSRAINQEDPRPGKEGRNATQYILPCLDTHDPLDVIIVMLGSNELKTEYNQTAEQTAQILKNFLQMILNKKSQFRDIQPKIILISPPLLDETTEYSSKGNKYLGATEKSKQFGVLFKKVAEELSVEFFDAAPITQTGPDGAHITEDSHKMLGTTLAEIIQNL